MGRPPELKNWLRGRVAVLLLLLPALCTLLPLIAITPRGGVRLAVLLVWAVLACAAGVLTWQVVRRLRGEE